MNRLLFVFFASVLACSPAVHAADGLVAIKSPYSVGTTMDRFEAAAKARSLTVFARIDHAAGAARIGETLRPTQLLIFGNPKGGTPFMACAQTVGIDLPLKVLVWKDADGQVWLGYNDPGYIAQRHGAAGCPSVAGLRKALSGLVDAALAP